MPSTNESAKDYKFEGWVQKDKKLGNMTWEEYSPKTWTEDDVDIKITHCGICASDLHTLRSGWGPTDYPQVVGHEIVGTVVKAGKNVKNIAVGDRVGVGAQSGSCLKCKYCKEGREPYCDEGQIGTYNGRYPDKSKSSGGYADYARVPSHFAFKIPDGLPSEVAAPLMCGGVTVYSPLKQLEAGPGKRIGIVGIGGLGHFGLLFAKALGAEPVAISHSSKKKEDATKMGAVEFISTKDDKDWAKTHRRTLDGIVCTANNHDMPLYEYAGLLKPGGKIILVGLPEEEFPPLKAVPLVMNNVFIGGSAIGGTHEINEMLETAAKGHVKPWIQTRPLKDANQAVLDMEDGQAKYRYVLVNEKHAA
ncbi:putative NADP-dependent alcohol dehydrogenase C 2 [Fimicolochytrium jonesii]|uniref:putative NADP-dependent alcohol dehydrogenase C 2 n=1 Tax=Fimicolochytrium jonesii TaxID=1396493 RepID=UPI0022FE5F07|nr:putative NADP-dependent alcohol dehydrogenase C 2 [Fimicolochytrium jonesii]KAI8824996.1 putative NADP-dependent alcohol dehydrogenase C 2 [Fimicolochytrium jonesii]